MTFRDLGLIAPILAALDDQGYTKPSPIQEKAIPPALKGRDVLGLAQTGTGKTCAFAAPILQRLNAAPVKGRPIRALILTPTRELAIQIGENFGHYGKNLSLRTAVIFGGVGQAPQVEQLKKGVDVLVATPGRLGDLYQQKLLDLSRIEIFVLDEADRMLDMGFIHDVKKILKWLPQKKQTMLFSATMPKEITDLVDSLLHDPARVAVDPVSSPVEAIRQSVCFVDKANKTKLLAHLVRERGVKNALVFTRTKHGANKVARDLVKEGISAAAIHGNKSQTARQQALQDFKSGAVRCLVATDIAARGLDIEELSHVFNYNLPEVPETYVHRIGRTGRAGRGGEAIAFCDFGEKPLLKDIEKLIGRAVPVIDGHPFPMQVFEAPKKDKNGRVINPEDAEARAAAKQLRLERDAAAKAAAQQRKEKAAQTLLTAPAAQEPPAGEGKKKKRKKKNAAKTEQVVLQPVAPAAAPEPPKAEETPAYEIKHERPKLTRPGSRMETGDAMPQTEFRRPSPLDGDRIMDATARLLAPRRSIFSDPGSQSFRSLLSSAHRQKKEPVRLPPEEPVTPTAPAPEEAQPQSAAPKAKKKKRGKKSADKAAVTPETRQAIPQPAQENQAPPAPKAKKKKPAKKAAPKAASEGKAPAEVSAGQTAAPKAKKKKPAGKAAPAKNQTLLRAEPPAKAAAAKKDAPAPKAKKKRAKSKKASSKPLSSGRTKDSTEQESLMKPYYLNF